MMEIKNIFEFILSTYFLLGFFVAVSMALYFSPQIQDKIIEELEKDGMSGSISYIMHKKYISPLLSKIVGIVLLLHITFLAFMLLITDVNNDLNLLIAIPLLILNLFIQHKIVLYIINAGKRIRAGEKKTFLLQIENAIILAAVPEEMFKICLMAVYVLHIAAILKIIF